MLGVDKTKRKRRGRRTREEIDAPAVRGALACGPASNSRIRECARGQRLERIQITPASGPATRRIKHAQVDVPELAWKDKAKQSKANYIFFAVFKLKKQATKQCEFTCIGGRGQDKGSMTRPNTSRKFPMNLGGIFYDFVCIGSFFSNCLHGFRAVHVREGAGSPHTKGKCQGVLAGPSSSMCLCGYSLPSVCRSVSCHSLPRCGGVRFSFLLLMSAPSTSRQAKA